MVGTGTNTITGVQVTGRYINNGAVSTVNILVNGGIVNSVFNVVSITTAAWAFLVSNVNTNMIVSGMFSASAHDMSVAATTVNATLINVTLLNNTIFAGSVNPLVINGVVTAPLKGNATTVVDGNWVSLNVNCASAMLSGNAAGTYFFDFGAITVRGGTGAGTGSVTSFLKQQAGSSAPHTCTVAADLGWLWFDSTTTTTAVKVCVNVAGTIGWSVVTKTP